jgi:Protein kinase domain
VERRPRARADRLAAAMADGAAVDWAAVESSAAGASHADLVRQLRVIAAMRGRHAEVRREPRVFLRGVVTGVYALAVTMAAAKVLVALAALAATLAQSRLLPAATPFAVNLTIFGIGGLWMVGGGGRDRRLQLLGGLYLTIACAFVDPFRPQAAGPAAVFLHLLASSKPEAFMALGVWLFAWAFPQETSDRAARRAAGTFIGAALLVAVVVFAANVMRLQQLWPDPPAHVAAAMSALNRNAPRSLHWPLLFIVAFPAIPFLLVKSRRAETEGRHRVQLFLVALSLGVLPMVAAVIATPFVPALRDPDVRRRLGVMLYLALGSIVPMTAYAVAVDRVMNLQFVIRATLQYALARYAIWAAILLPLTYLALDVFINRGLTFLEYLTARQPSGLLTFSGLGLVVLAFRPQLVGRVDRWFLREPLDAGQALARLERRFRTSDHLRDISGALAEELTRALHVEHVHVLLLAESGGSLVALDGSVPAMPRQSVLLGLLQSTRRELLLDARSAVVPLLPDADQDWLRDTGAELLSPLVGSDGGVLGVVAIGPAVSGLASTPEQAALVTAMSGQTAMQLENRWLRASRGASTRQQTAMAGVGWQDEPATWCSTCATVWPPETQRCRCGAVTKPAVLPLFVNDKFRLQRFLGAGGTGVVYLATDLALDRKVAIKTLPPMRREYAERLRREARAMASVRHPNLATIYGVEEWHDTPLLVVEYLEGGTLFDWLLRGPAPVDEVLDLGIMLADVLDRVHGSGVLHRDIKPSNIGYTADGVPMLLDFGLAAMLDRSRGPGVVVPVMPADPAEIRARFADLGVSSTLTITQQVVGTPLYLSPEAMAGSPPRESFDLWSLALVLYEAIAGRHPLAGRTVADVVHAVQHSPLPDLRDVRPECPAPVAAFFAEALSRVEARRPKTAGDLRTALRALRAGLGQAR